MVDAWRERIHPGDVEAATRQIGLALIEGRGWTMTYRIRDARGRYRSMLERGLIQRNSAGDPVRAIGCCVDVSEIKRLTDLLGEAQRTAKMGGWEYSYSTLELTWTDEMFRIFETAPGAIRRVLGCDAGAVHRRSRGSDSTRPGGARNDGRRSSTSSSRSRRLTGAAHLGPGHRAHREARRPLGARLRIRAEHPGARSSRRSRSRTAPAGSSSR